MRFDLRIVFIALVVTSAVISDFIQMEPNERKF